MRTNSLTFERTVTGPLIPSKDIPRAMWIAAILINMSAVMYGYCIVSLNSCLVLGSKQSYTACYQNDDDGSPSCPKGTIYNNLELTTDQVQLASSIVCLGAWIGSLVGSYPLEKFGRRSTLLANNLFFIVGAFATGSGNIDMLYVGKFVAGFGVGVTSCVVPVLLSEIASDAQRGNITGLFPVFARGGMLLTGLIAYFFVTYVNNGWQYVQCLACVPSFIQLCKFIVYDY